MCFFSLNADMLSILKRRIQSQTTPPSAFPSTPKRHADTPVSPRRSRHLQATRVPDFLQRLFFGKLTGPLPLPDEAEDPTRTILLVEIKRGVRNTTQAGLQDYYLLEDLRQAAKQNRTQARFAFAEDPNLTFIAGLLAVGQYWTYVEYEKDEMGESPKTGEEFGDPTYQASPEDMAVDEEDDPIMPAEVVRDAFGGNVFLDLEDMEASSVAFSQIRDHLRSRNADVW